MIVPTAEGSGAVVLSALASASKDEMTIGGLYVFDGIDVVAVLVRGGYVAFRGNRNVHNQDLIARHRAGINNGRGTSATEAVELHDARTVENFDSVRQGRAKEVREVDEFEV